MGLAAYGAPSSTLTRSFPSNTTDAEDVYTSLGTPPETHASMTLRVPVTFTSCMSALLAVLAAAGAAVAQWNTTSQPGSTHDLVGRSLQPFESWILDLPPKI